MASSYFICFYFLLFSNQIICFHCYRYFTVFCSTFRIVNKKIYGNKKSGAIFVAKQGTVPCYAEADHAKVKSRPYDLLFPAPLRCGSGVRSARSKRINAHGTPPFPFHFPFQVSNDCSSNHSVYILHIFSEIVNTFYTTYWKYFTNCITMLKLYRK